MKKGIRLAVSIATNHTATKRAAEGVSEKRRSLASWLMVTTLTPGGRFESPGSGFCSETLSCYDVETMKLFCESFMFYVILFTQ